MQSSKLWKTQVPRKQSDIDKLPLITVNNEPEILPIPVSQLWNLSIGLNSFLDDRQMAKMKRLFKSVRKQISETASKYLFNHQY